MMLYLLIYENFFKISQENGHIPRSLMDSTIVYKVFILVWIANDAELIKLIYKY